MAEGVKFAKNHVCREWDAHDGWRCLTCGAIEERQWINAVFKAVQDYMNAQPLPKPAAFELQWDVNYGRQFGIAWRDGSMRRGIRITVLPWDLRSEQSAKALAYQAASQRLFAAEQPL